VVNGGRDLSDLFVRWVSVLLEELYSYIRTRRLPMEKNLSISTDYGERAGLWWDWICEIRINLQGKQFVCSFLRATWS
jgi:hypothetical protein